MSDFEGGLAARITWVRSMNDVRFPSLLPTGVVDALSDLDRFWGGAPQHPYRSLNRVDPLQKSIPVIARNHNCIRHRNTLTQDERQRGPGFTSAYDSRSG